MECCPSTTVAAHLRQLAAVPTPWTRPALAAPPPPAPDSIGGAQWPPSPARAYLNSMDKTCIEKLSLGAYLRWICIQDFIACNPAVAQFDDSSAIAGILFRVR